MRASTLTLIAAVAAVASAQIPSCATSCITNSLPASCNLNPSCICADTSFITGISCCVSTACDEAGQQAALSYAQSICAPVGVTNLPTKASCASSTGSSSGSSTAAAAAASGSSSSTTGSSSAAAVSSASSSLSSAVSSISSSARSGSSSAGSSKSSSAGAQTASSTAASSTATPTGSADKVAAHGVGLVGMVAGAFALL